MRTLEERLALYNARKRERSPLMQTAQEVRDYYNGDVVIPLPEIEKSERPSVANLLALGLDQTAMRIASTEPDAFFAPIRPGFDKHEKDANTRRNAMLSFWEMNALASRMGRKARQFIGYGLTASIIVPDFKRRIPKWVNVDPLSVFPSATSDPDDMTPDDCIIAYLQSGRWVAENYPEAWAQIRRSRYDDESVALNRKYQVIEYVDAEIRALDLIGEEGSPSDVGSGQASVNLVQRPNLAEVCLAVIPGRVTLDRRSGQFDQMLGIALMQAQLHALGVIATKKGIFPDEWLISRQNEQARVIKLADGLKGEIGVIMGGDRHVEHLDPSYQLPQMMSTLERHQRIGGGVPAQMGGENATNVRTGRASDAVLGATIDFTVQEAQRVLALGREFEDKRAIAVDKAYFKGKKSFYVSFDGRSVREDYDPAMLWETDHHTVAYSHAGADENGLTIEIGQLVGMDLISKETARRAHPRIKDYITEGATVIKEGLQAAVLSGIQQKAAEPGANIRDIARIAQLVTEQGMSIIAATIKVDDEAAARQAKIDAQGNDTTALPGSPETMPGLAAPGMGNEAAAAPPTIDAPAAAIANFANLSGRLRQPQMMLSSEMGGARA